MHLKRGSNPLCALQYIISKECTKMTLSYQASAWPRWRCYPKLEMRVRLTFWLWSAVVCIVTHCCFITAEALKPQLCVHPCKETVEARVYSCGPELWDAHWSQKPCPHPCLSLYLLFLLLFSTPFPPLVSLSLCLRRSHGWSLLNHSIMRWEGRVSHWGQRPNAVSGGARGDSWRLRLWWDMK